MVWRSVTESCQTIFGSRERRESERMLKYIVKRVIGVIPTLIIVTTFVFFFVRLIPGDPARLVAGPQATLEDVEVVREELGLNKP